MKMEVKTIDPREAAARMNQDGGAVLLDVRTPAEYAACHAENARLVPLDGLDAGAVMGRIGPCNGSPVYVICAAGSRSAKACQKFMAAGYENVVSVQGGTQAWKQAGLPVVESAGGRGVLPLDRQVRIAVGSLVILGTVLAWWVNPAFVWLCGFVGAGLTFAGVTDICPLATLVAAMPWNRRGGSAPVRSCCTPQ